MSTPVDTLRTRIARDLGVLPSHVDVLNAQLLMAWALGQFDRARLIVRTS